MAVRYPLLNFIELNKLAASINAQLAGARVDRVYIPAMPEHPNGYFKQEWCIDFYDQKGSGQFFFSLRSQACSAFAIPSKTLKAASAATRSGFDLSLVKYLEGLRLNKVSAISNERILELNFGPKDNQKNLLLYFIPANPEAVLTEPMRDTHQVLHRSRDYVPFHYPTGRTLPPELQNKFSINLAYGENLENYASQFLKIRTDSAIEIRFGRIEKLLRERTDYWKTKIDSFKEHLAHQDEEQTWSRYGALLQAQLYTKPVLNNGFYELMDYEKNETVKIPGNPRFGLKQQLEFYFHQAKRIKTRTQEGIARTASAQEKICNYSRLLEKLSGARGSENLLATLLEIESHLGITKSQAAATKTTPNKAVGQFGGKTFVSQEGLNILVGRNAAENMELFKLARGNDIWMHVKGRPGAHVVVILPPKKSASLDTLLDAAHLCIHYSGGKDWGKTEIDYTYRKFVKKIKNQTEVSYTQNKTLMVVPEVMRTTRLLK